MKHTKKVILLFTTLTAFSISNVYATNGVVNKDGVRVRKEPSTSASIVTVLDKDAPIDVLEETNGWYKIKYTSSKVYEGYMSKEFIKVNGEVPNTTPVATPTTEVTDEPTKTPKETTAPEEVASPETTTQQETVDTKSALLGEKVVSDETSIYILPSITSSIKDTVKKNTKIVVQEVAGNFAYIKYNDSYGWIRISVITEKTKEPETPAFTEKVGYVNVTQAIIRQKATTESEMITALNFNSEVTIVGEEGDFYKIKIKNGQYYIAKRLISDSKQTTNRGESTRQKPVVEQNTTELEEQLNIQEVSSLKENSKEEIATPVSSMGDQIAQMAKSYLGYKYVYGGASPSTGFDCSGLVYYICGQFGYKVNRTADAQANNGVYVEKANLQPGDLVFFSNYKTYQGIGHVGIYIGDGQFVHASTPTLGVITSSLNQTDYVRRYVTARRVY